MVRRPSRRTGINAPETKIAKIKPIDEHVDHTNRIITVDKVVQALRQQSRLAPLNTFNETLHIIPRPIDTGIITAKTFLHSQGHERRFGSNAGMLALPPAPDLHGSKAEMLSGRSACWGNALVARSSPYRSD